MAIKIDAAYHREWRRRNPGKQGLGFFNDDPALVTQASLYLCRRYEGIRLRDLLEKLCN